MCFISFFVCIDIFDWSDNFFHFCLHCFFIIAYRDFLVLDFCCLFLFVVFYSFVYIVVCCCCCFVALVLFVAQQAQQTSCIHFFSVLFLVWLVSKAFAFVCFACLFCLFAFCFCFREYDENLLTPPSLLLLLFSSLFY